MLNLPEGYNLDATANVLNEIERRVQKHKEVTHILTDLGKVSDLDIGTNMAAMNIQLVDVKQREAGSGYDFHIC